MKNKKFLSLLLTIILVLGSVVPALAETTSPMYIDAETKAQYETTANVIKAMKAKETNPKDVYERTGDNEYKNVINTYEAKKDARIDFIKEKGIKTPEELMANEELQKEFIEAGNKAVGKIEPLTKEEVLDMEIDDEELEVTEVSAINAKTVEVKFTKAVEESTVITGGGILQNITFSNIGSAPAVTPANLQAELSEDGKTLTIVNDVTTNEIFDGQYAVLVPVAVTDTDGNAVEAYSSIVTLEDTARPTVSGPMYISNNVAKFEFSEPMNIANNTALQALSTVKDSNGATIATPTMTLAADKESFEVDITGLTLNENYTLTMIGAADFAGKLISPNPVTVNLVKENADTENPEVVSVEAINDTNLIVTFSEPVDTTGTIFKLDAGQTGAVAVTTTEATVSDDKTEVNVNLNHANFSTLTFAGLTRIDITEYQDLSGNPSTPTDSAYNKLVTFTADADAPEVLNTTVETIAGTRYIVVEFNEDVTVTPAALPTVTYIDGGVQKTLTGGINVAAVTAHDKDNDGNNDSIKIDTENYDGSNAVMPEGAYTITLPANLAADAAGNNSAATTVDVTVGTLSPTDTTKPVILGGAAGITMIDNDTMQIQFSEEVTNATGLNVANYTIGGVQAFDSAIFIGDRSLVELTLIDGIINLNGSRLVEVKNIADDAGNVMNDASFAKTLTENVKPEMLSAQIVDTDEVLVTFSEGLLASSIATGDFTVKVNGTAVTVTTVTKADGNALANGDTKVLLTLTTGIANASDVVTVEIADGVIDDVNSNSNNGAKTVTATN